MAHTTPVQEDLGLILHPNPGWHFSEALISLLSDNRFNNDVSQVEIKNNKNNNSEVEGFELTTIWLWNLAAIKKQDDRVCITDDSWILYTEWEPRMLCNCNCHPSWLVRLFTMTRPHLLACHFVTKIVFKGFKILALSRQSMQRTKLCPHFESFFNF